MKKLTFVILSVMLFACGEEPNLNFGNAVWDIDCVLTGNNVTVTKNIKLKAFNDSTLAPYQQGDELTGSWSQNNDTVILDFVYKEKDKTLSFHFYETRFVYYIDSITCNNNRYSRVGWNNELWYLKAKGIRLKDL